MTPSSASHCVLFLQEDCDNVLAALQPRGMAMMSHDIVQSVNKILKVGSNDHSDCGGGRAKHPTLREANVVAQVWEQWFLQFGMQQVLLAVVSIALQGAAFLAALPPLGGAIPYCLVVD